MFTLHWMDKAAENYAALRARADDAIQTRKSKKKTKSSKDEGLFKQVYKAIELLRANPKHPGLHTHDYDSLTNPYNKDAKVFEAYAQNATPGAYRVFWCYGPGKREITIIAITPHP